LFYLGYINNINFGGLSMEYHFIGRDLEITDAMRSHAEDKFDKLDRFFNQIIDAKVVMSYNSKGTSTPARVEVQLNIPNGILRAEENGVDTYAAVDLVLDKLERQLKRYKGKWEVRQQRQQDEPSPFITLVEDDANDYIEEPAEVVRVKQHTLRPMAPEDAAIQMDGLGHDFYLFRNSETDKVSVIYLRDDGNYGVIEPANR